MAKNDTHQDILISILIMQSEMIHFLASKLSTSLLINALYKTKQ